MGVVPDGFYDCADDQQRLAISLREIANRQVPTAEELQIKPETALREKWDWVLPIELRVRSYISARLDT